MAAFLEAIADRIVAAGHGVQPDANTDVNNGVYVGRMPHTATHGILIYNRPTGSRVDNTIPGYLRTRGTIVCRGNEYQEVMTRAFAVKKSIHLTEHSEDMSGVIFVELYGESEPHDYPFSEGHFTEIAFNFRAAYLSDGDWNPI